MTLRMLDFAKWFWAVMGLSAVTAEAPSPDFGRSFGGCWQVVRSHLAVRAAQNWLFGFGQCCWMELIVGAFW